MNNPTADEVGTLIMRRRAAEKLPPFTLRAEMTCCIAAHLKRLGIPHAEAHYQAGVCLTCGECGRCPGVHTFEEIQKAARAASRDRTTRLPAFRVTYEDGESYVTSMAAGVTLAEARSYFVGTRHTMSDEKTTKPVATGEEVPPHVK